MEDSQIGLQNDIIGHFGEKAATRKLCLFCYQVLISSLFWISLGSFWDFFFPGIWLFPSLFLYSWNFPLNTE